MWIWRDRFGTKMVAVIRGGMRIPRWYFYDYDRASWAYFYFSDMEFFYCSIRQVSALLSDVLHRTYYGYWISQGHSEPWIVEHLVRV